MAIAEVVREREVTRRVELKPASERLVSLDAMRGFDMFWIAGGDALVKALATATGLTWMAKLATQFTHVDWVGFHFYDLIFPMFIFISGLTLPLTLTRRLARGEGRGWMVGRLFWRALILVALGILYNNGPVSLDVDNLRFCSVLGRIGLAGLGAGLIVVFARPRTQVVWAAGLLLLYWALMTLVPVPGQAGHSFDSGKNLADWIDARLLPGKFVYPNNHEPQGLLSTIPSVSLALLGALAGAWLISDRPAWRKVVGLLCAGVFLLDVGWVWSWQFPIIKHLWTSTFIMITAGCSCLILALFYGVLDGLRWRWWAFPFVLIGLNPLTLYFLKGTRLIDFNGIGQFLFGYAISFAHKPWTAVWTVVATIAVEMAFLYFLYRKKVFLRV